MGSEYWTSKKTATGSASTITITTTSAIPAGTSITVTVFEDVGNDGSGANTDALGNSYDNSASTTLAGGSGETNDLAGFDGGGSTNAYWMHVELDGDGTDPTLDSPTLDSVDAATDTGSTALGLTGSATGTATATGTLTRTRVFAGSATGSATTTASLTRARSFTGTATGTATTSASLSLSGQLALVGAATATATAAGTLSRGRPLAGSASASATASGAVTRGRTLSASATGSATSTASLTRARTLTATATGTAAATGTLSTVVAGAVDLTTPITLAAALDPTTTLTARLPMPAENQDATIDSGDAEIIQFEADLSDANVPDDLTGATAEWVASVTAGSEPVLSDGDSGVSVAVTEPTSDPPVVEVSLETGATAGIHGRYHHELDVVDAGGDRHTAALGTLRIRRGSLE